MVPEISWTHPVVVAELPEQGAEFKLSPDDAARASLAKFAGVIAVPALKAVLNVKPDANGGALVEGTLEATVTQECGVTLEPFDNHVSEEISLRFVAGDSGMPVAETEEDEFEIDPPDQLENGTLNLAMVAAEFLALGVDPYPRKSGVVFKAPEGGEKPSAFSALEALKRGKGEGKG